MKTLIMAVAALVIWEAGLFAQPPSNAKAEEAVNPMVQKTMGRPPQEHISQQAGEQQSDLTQYILAENSDSGDAATSETDTLSGTDSPTPTGLELSQNYPNPFNSDTEIKYGLPIRSSVQISVYNIFGQRVRTIKDSIEDSGYYSVNWDGRDDNGDLLASGMYFYVFASDDNYLTRKMMFLK